MKPYKYVCTNCGSDKVSLEGFITWNKHTQQFEVDDLCDKGHYCGVCDGECRVEARDLTGEEMKELET